MAVTVRIKYRSATNQKYTDDYILEMGDLEGYLMLGESPLGPIAEDMDEIRRNTRSLAKNFPRLESSLSSIAIAISS